MSALHPTLRSASTGEKVRERDFQRLVIDLAHLYRWKVAHFRPARTEHGWATPVAADGKGFPDLVLCHVDPDMVIFAELKIDRSWPTDDQLDWLEKLRGAGAEVRLWHYPADWMEIRQTLSFGALR